METRDLFKADSLRLDRLNYVFEGGRYQGRRPSGVMLVSPDGWSDNRRGDRPSSKEWQGTARILGPHRKVCIPIHRRMFLKRAPHWLR